MAAPRASSFKALKNLSSPAKRNLHLTNTQASPRIATTHQKTAFLGLGLLDLRSECKRRILSPSGTKHELIDRLVSHDALQARAMSIAMKRITNDQTKKGTPSTDNAPPSRHFNTSRVLKAVHDTSTIDFAYLPKLFDGSLDPAPAAIRVPILPDINSEAAEAVLENYPELDAAAGGYQGTEGGMNQMKAQIVTVHDTLAEGDHVEGGDKHSAMSDVFDGHTSEMSVDQIAELTKTVGNSAKRLMDMVKDKDEATIRKIWSGFLDDVLGPKSKAA